MDIFWFKYFQGQQHNITRHFECFTGLLFILLFQKNRFLVSTFYYVPMVKIYDFVSLCGHN